MTLFVGGVHAVGKTFALKTACEDLGLRHLTASQLIKEQRGLSNWTATRQVDDIDENQNALVAAVRRLERGGEILVLDGHFVLRKTLGVHEKIGMEIFSQINVQGIILLEAPIELVVDRLRQRGDETWEPSEVELFAQRELEHAEAVSKILGVRLLKLLTPSKAEVKEALHNLMSGSLI
ncbi:AAA family ATPase [Oxalobacteraceae bacterium CAVE-383]|nr:AAA family ATPase [Oxalobacteraceae bacterium CAVE-383]